MIKGLAKRISLVTTLGVLTFAAGAGADDVRLPDMGSPADAILSNTDEARLGRMIMRDIRNSGQVVEDPLITEYLNDIGSRIAAQTNDGAHNFSFFAIDDERINAFALPGGYIGVHTGLLEAARSEDELAGVMAHEVAHVTQRHIARAIHANSRQSILTTAMMLGAIIVAAAGGSSDAVQGAMAVAQGTAAQQQINFTRNNEYEADRVGIAALADAGFDPYGMASFFEVISRQQTTSPEMRAPEFLRTHPVTTARIAEARNRARDYAPVLSDDTTSYGIARMRAIVMRFDTPEQAVAWFESRAHDRQSGIERYGRAVAYQKANRHFEALPIFEGLLEEDQSVIAYHIGLGQTLVALDQWSDAVKLFERALELFPRNVPLVIAYGERLLDMGQPKKAHTMLLDLMNNVPPTPEQVRLLARAASLAGEEAEAYYYLSEYRLMIGDLNGGIGYLQQALRLPDLKDIQRARFQARIDFIREFMTEEQLRNMRAQPVGLAIAR
ncbi:MAG: M48 family metalloprotease [Gammaproteobacteria bacterium]|nr:M48 family metalloprotease [Gammaproteobacteria bacterium]MBT8105324.1 M48 family metalloprotease [Gammaproteobacteria bacterium]MBT8106785.1 M48 family metalloprotease [Gammaproteobacteria bacterium]NNK25338.1 M48 family metallopeptidase [Woeseiaceae bacterium]